MQSPNAMHFMLRLMSQHPSSVPEIDAQCRQVTIVEADDGLYAATIGGVVAMKLGPHSWSPGDCLPVFFFSTQHLFGVPAVPKVCGRHVQS